MIVQRLLPVWLLTVFSTWIKRASGACLSDEFECDNGVCIDDSRRCDGEDNCGDNSDEEGCPSLYLWIGIVIGALVLSFYIIMYIALFVAYCCKGRQERRRSMSSRVPVDSSALPANHARATFELGSPSEPYKESGEGSPGPSEAPPAYPASDFPSRSLSFPPPYASKSSNLESLSTLPKNCTHQE